MRTTSVVQVLIDGDTITVDGAVLPWDPATDSRSPYDVTLAALATSATRWRPVRAEITEASGITRCQVLRDGTTENLRFTYTGGVADLGAADVPPVPVVAATRSLVPARTRRLPPVPWRFAVTGLGIACLVGLVALSVHQLALPGRPVDDVRIAAAIPTSPVTQPLEPGSSFRPLPVLRVEAVPVIGGIEFRGERLWVVVVIDRVSHRLRLDHDGVILDGLAAGSHDWTASGPGRLDASGTTDVLSPPAPTTSTTPTPEPPATQQTLCSAHRPGPDPLTMRSRLVLLVAAALVAVVLPAAVTSAESADRVAVGYRIRIDGTAGGGWIGARKVWPRLVYRLDPGAHRTTTPSFGPAHRVRVLTGSGARAVTRRDTARAAYILSAYGQRRDHPAQNAAVEVALDHLLVGGRYARQGAGTLARIRQTGNAAEIGYLADYMLQDSQRFAGPYRVRIERQGTTLGGYAHVRVRVTAARSGAPFATLPVVVRVPGKHPQVVRTDADGRAAVSWHATRAGLLDVRLTVKEVPETRLLVRTPSRRGASRIAIAGVKRLLTRHVRVPVKAHPSVAISQPAVHRLDASTAGVLTVSHGVDSPRTATATLFGPYAAPGDVACAGTDVGSGSVTVGPDGAYALPQLSLTDVGYYVWGVQLAGNNVNEPAAACGAAFVARQVPRVTIKVPDNRVSLGSRVRAWWTVASLPPDFNGTLRIRLFGPFADADHVSCSGTTGRSEQVAITGPTSAWSTSYTPTRSGLYAWRVTLPGSEFSTPAATTCVGPATMVRLVR